MKTGLEERGRRGGRGKKGGRKRGRARELERENIMVLNYLNKKFEREREYHGSK